MTALSSSTLLTVVGNATITSNIIYGDIAIGVGSSIIWNNTITGVPSGSGYQPDDGVLRLSSATDAIVSNNRITGTSLRIPDYASLGMRPDLGPFYTNYGIVCNGNQTVTNNVISGCTKASILVNGNASIQKNTLNDKGIILDAPKANINYNNFEGGAGLYLWEHAQGAIDAANNWWGTTDRAAINQAIYDYNDDFNLGKVTYEPFLDTPNSNAVPDSNMPMPTPTPRSIPISTSSPTLTPTQPNSRFMGDLSSLDLEQSVIIALVVVIAALVVVVVVLLRTRRA